MGQWIRHRIDGDIRDPVNIEIACLKATIEAHRKALVSIQEHFGIFANASSAEIAEQANALYTSALRACLPDVDS